ncbi:hypothetical protein HY798_01150 [Candidatus Falkowbacteria bacterium]|nr:hypothetical protein [Candidatus Falkowbacteria bacterium]
MHDLYLANQIVKLAKEHAMGEKIKKIAIELGDIFEHGENVTSKNLKYNINLILPRVTIKIKRVKSDQWRLKEIETK